MLSYKKLTDEDWTDAPVNEITDSKAPFVLFLGGLMHFNGVGVNRTLGNIIAKFMGNTSTPVYLPMRDGSPDPSDSDERIYSFIRDGSIAPETREIFNEILYPAALKERLAVPGVSQAEILHDHFRRINIVGYSYGTTLIQQFERLLDEEISRGDGPAALKEAAALIGAINIGPTACPYDSHGQRYGMETQDFNGAKNLLTQLFVYKANDKVMQTKIGTALVPPQQDSAVCRGSSTLGFVCDFEGDEWIRELSTAAWANGIPYTKLDYWYDAEAHDLRLYTNKPGISGQKIIFPSLLAATALREGMDRMLAESADTNLQQRQFPAAAMATLRGAALAEAVADLRTLRADFNDVVQAYSSATPKKCFEILAGQREKIARIENGRMPL